MSLETALNSSLVEWGFLIHGALVGLLEVGGMFYALAQIAKHERETREKGRAEGEAIAVKRLEEVASPEQIDMLRELIKAAGLSVNRQGRNQ